MTMARPTSKQIVSSMKARPRFAKEEKCDGGDNDRSQSGQLGCTFNQPFSAGMEVERETQSTNIQDKKDRDNDFLNCHSYPKET